MKVTPIFTSPFPRARRSRTRRAGLTACFGVLLIFSGLGDARGDKLIGIDGFEGTLYDIDPATGADSNTVTLGGRIPCFSGGGIVSLARHPGTGVLYAVNNSGSNALYTVDPATGSTTKVVDITGIGWITTITFGPAPGYELFAIIGGDGAVAPQGSIHTINPVTGATTPKWATSGSGGHALEFNPDDGLLYHFFSSGGSGTDPDGLETVDPATGAMTAVPLTGAAYGSVNGIVYSGSGLFHAYDNQNGDFLSITSAGVVSTLGNFGFPIQALESNGGNLYATEFDILHQVNPVTAAIASSVDLIDGTCPVDFYSIARDRATGTYFAITDGTSFFADRLVIVDVSTGAISNPLDLSEDGISGITVGPGGQIFGVTGPNSSLTEGTIVIIDKVTGAVTDTGFASTQTGGGHSLEYNPDDGLLYHFFGDPANLESIVPGTGAVTAIGAVSGLPLRFNGAVYAGGGSFFALSSNGFIYAVTTAGVGTRLGRTGINPPFVFPRGLEMRAEEIQPDLSTGIKRSKLKGNDVYNTTGAGQKTRLVRDGKPTGKVLTKVENDGRDAGPISVRGTKGNAKLSVKYLAGGKNVTAAVTRNGHTTTLNPGQSLLYKIKLRRKSDGRAGRKFQFRASSAAGDDVASAKVVMKP